MKKINLINTIAIVFTSSLLLAACGGSSNTVDEASEDTTTVDSNVTTDDSTMVSVDQEKCIGCGACVGMCPDVFELLNGKSHVKNKECPNCDCQSVVNTCPVNAISL